MSVSDKIEFAILGTSAIGSIVGAHLAKAGHFEMAYHIATAMDRDQRTALARN